MGQLMNSPSRSHRLLLAGVLGCACALGTVGTAAGASNALLDPAFGRGGVEMFPFATGAVPEDDEANAVALDAQGRAVVVGEADIPARLAWRPTAPSRLLALARIDAAGDLDPSFGTGGRATLAYGGENTYPSGGAIPDTMQDNEAFDVVLQPDGALVIAGDSNVYYRTGRTTNNIDATVARVLPDGSPDPSFGVNGFAHVSVDPLNRRNDTGRAVALQPDGKIVIAGFGSRPGAVTGFHDEFLVARLTAEGQPDASFNAGVAGNTSGVITTSFMPDLDDNAYDVAVQPDGKIVVVGHADVGPVNGSAVTDLAIARYLPDGTLDPSFGTGGKVLHDHGTRGQEFGWALELQPDGKILVGGYTQVGAQTDVSITRFNADGSVDRAFGGDGVASESIGAGSDAFTHILLQPDGSILGTGYAKETPDGGYDMVVARFHPDGSHDTTFGPDDYQLFSFGTGNDIGRGAALRPDGRLMVAGSGSDGDDIDFVTMQIRQPTSTTLELSARRPVIDTAPITATATVVSDTGHAPTGAVTFTACGPAQPTGGSCPPGSGTIIGTGTLSESAVATGRATSPVLTPNAAGTWCIRADYAATISTVESSATACTSVAAAMTVSPNRRALEVLVPEGATDRRVVITAPGRRVRPIVSITPKAGTVTRISANRPASHLGTWFETHRRVSTTVRLAYRLDGVDVNTEWRATVQAAPGRLRGQWLGKRLGAWDVIPPTLSARQKAGIRGYPGGYAAVRQKPGSSATFAALKKL